MMFKYKGYIFSIISAIIFGLMPIMAKYLYSIGGNSISLVFYRTFLSLPVLYLISKHNNIDSMKINKNEFKKILIIVIGYTLTPLLLYSSYHYISSGVSTTIHFCYPIIILISSTYIYKSKVSKIDVFCVILCTVGILLITNFKEVNSIVGILLAFFSGIAYAFYALYLDKSGLNEMNTYKLCFYIALFSSIIVFIYAILKGEFIMLLSTKGWILSFIFSIFVSVFAVIFFQIGVKLIGAQKASLLSTFEPLTSIIVGIVFLNESLNLLKVVSIMLILISTIIIINEKSCKQNN